MNRYCLPLAGSLVLSLLAASAAEPVGPAETPLVAVTNPPLVQMLLPGFTVRQLPLELNNINSLTYSPDGRLFALGYDGNVWQLKDTDGDGLADTATCFFKNEHNEIPPSIGMAWGPGGLYIASQRRVIRLRDKGDGTSELETVTSGWVPPTGAAGSGLDAVGVAVDAKGNVFFGLGCDDWPNPYRLNKETGESKYNLHSERGCILKVSPDWKRRETVCTGIRFTVSMAFNSAGDLFCTDQEGATWLANGNPFDELLHIQPGRHYGFPPRHPKYLPNVIDEPSVFDYAPQHQSTCGLHFNDPVAGGSGIFGPAWWRGDAIIAGESRGKIWRTKLVKTAAGYVAHNNLIACLSMLTIDAAPTPQGDIVVTCHSGKPDWGTGPQGKGKLFKISYTDTNAPQPVLAYAVSPTETRITFDRPLDPGQFKNLAKQTTIAMGKYVTAGERFESFRPGYQAVKDQQLLPRYVLPVLSAGITADNRSLILQTAPRTEAANYAVTLPRLVQTNNAQTELRYALPDSGRHEVDVLSDLTGVEATWRNASGKMGWSGWLPHLDLTAARAFTAVSDEHAQLFDLLHTRGTLTLRAQMDLWLMLHPAIQPGAKLDYEYPAETVTVVFRGSGKLALKAGGNVQRVNAGESRLTTVSRQNQLVPVEITLHTGPGEPKLAVSWFTAEDSRPRALPLRRILVPWATCASGPANITSRSIPEIAGGDWERGKKIFFGDQATCYKCHQIRGEGGVIGPDLSNLVYRDYGSVYRDVTEPSAALNPDYIAYNFTFKDGEGTTGVVVEDQADRIVLGDPTGARVTILKADVTSRKASAISLMPEGLLKALDTQQQKDLFTFLLTEPAKGGKN